MVALSSRLGTGVLVDDYFYRLKVDGERAQAPLRMVCTLLIAQLPTPVQAPIKEWLATKDEIVSRQARAFVEYVRKTLTERGIALDKGNRDFSRVCKVLDERTADKVSEKGLGELPVEIHEEYVGGKSREQCAEPINERVTAVRYQGGRKWNRQPRVARNSNVWTSRKTGCFICGTEGHFARNCPEQFCQQCGRRGHDRRDCRARHKVMIVDSKDQSQAISESAVVVQITLNDFPYLAMIDTGAQHSIVDRGTLASLGEILTASPGRIHGVGATPVVTLGTAQLKVDIGQDKRINHKFLVLDSTESTIIWGDFYLNSIRQNLTGQIIGFVSVIIGSLLRPHCMEDRFCRA